MNKIEKRKTKIRNNKGITLVALVITIIVLLILAGVSIAMLTGQNGIFTQAQNAKNRTEEARADEENKLTNYEDYINNATLDTATVGEIVTGGNKQYSKNGKAIIPEGFAIVPELDDVSQGLVISDVANDTENTGNQFVWIPVASLEDYKVNESYNDINISQNTKPDTDYLPDGIKPTDSSKTEEQAERETVVKAGGFYISRYEAGKEGTDTLVSKSGATVWVNQTHEEFKDIAKGFSGNTEHVKSALCSGTQWDMTMAFITANDTSYDVTVSNPYRHKGSSVGVQTSGQNPADIACNIYDLEGNCYEYVAEKNPLNSDFPFINRGGDYSDNIAASYRYYNGRYAPLSCSFRFVLYVM